MPNRKGQHSLAIASICFGFVGLMFTASSGDLFSQTTKQTKPSQATVIAETLKTSFGSALAVAKGFKPYYVTGDFNGDAAQDILVVTHLKGQRDELQGDVKLYDPFERPKAIYPADPSANPTLALAIIHGGKAGWQTPPALEKFLLFGSSPVLILNYQRLASSETQDKEALMELLRKGSRKYRGSGWPPAGAKGDSIVLGTEATDSILYWNGKNYRWEEAADAE
jgi:hypothetical protein